MTTVVNTIMVAIFNQIFLSSQTNDFYSFLLSLFYFLIFIMFFVSMLFPGFQLSLFTSFSLRRIGDKIVVLDELDLKSKKTLADQLKKFGADSEKLNEHIKELTEFFEISPVDRDPSGILNRLEYILDVARYRFRSLIKLYAPKVDENALSTLEDTASIAQVIHLINRIAKHYYNLAKKFKNYYIAQQVEFILPFLIDMAKSYFKALPATTLEVPIGDGIGPMVIARMYREFGVNEVKDVGNEMVVGEAVFQNRKLILLKASGPAGRVGKPGAAVRQIVKSMEGKINLIVTIDAALKLEGEETGEIAQGVGAAIGDPGPEKYKIEESALEYRIPLVAIIIKQGFNDAISPMIKTIADKADEVINRVKNLVLETVPEGGVALIVGIGNTLGVGNAA